MFRAISAAGLALMLSAGTRDPEPKRCRVVAPVAALDRPEGKRVVFEVSAHTGVLLLKQSGKENKWCEVWGGALGSGWIPCERTRLDGADVSFVLDGKVAAFDKPSGRATDLVFEKGQGGFLIKYSGTWCRLSAAAAGEGWVPCARGHIEGIKAAEGQSAKMARTRSTGRGR